MYTFMNYTFSTLLLQGFYANLLQIVTIFVTI